MFDCFEHEIPASLPGHWKQKLWYRTIPTEGKKNSSIQVRLDRKKWEGRVRQIAIFRIRIRKGDSAVLSSTLFYNLPWVKNKES